MAHAKWALYKKTTIELYATLGLRQVQDRNSHDLRLWSPRELANEFGLDPDPDREARFISKVLANSALVSSDFEAILRRIVEENATTADLVHFYKEIDKAKPDLRDYGKEGPWTDSGYSSLSYQASSMSPWIATNGAQSLSRAIAAEIHKAIYGEFWRAADWRRRDLPKETLHTFIKAFALKLGLESPGEIYIRIMHFIHENHQRISDLVAFECYPKKDQIREPLQGASDGMFIDDKMGTWGRELPEKDPSDNQAGRELVRKIEYDDGPFILEPVDLDVHTPAILHSDAHKWLLASLKREMCLQREVHPQNKTAYRIQNVVLNCLLEDDLRAKEPPKTFDVTIHLSTLVPIYSAEISQFWNRFVAICPEVPSSSSVAAQVMSISEYFQQTWPDSDLPELLNAIFILDQKQLPAIGFSCGELIARITQDQQLSVHVKDLPFSIAELAEQLGWLSAALQLPSSPLCTTSYQPRITRIGEFEFRVSSYPQPITHFTLPKQLFEDNRVQPIMIHNYPIGHQSDEYPGIELSTETLLTLGFLYISTCNNGHRLLHGKHQTIELILKFRGTWRWSLGPPKDTCSSLCHSRSTMSICSETARSFRHIFEYDCVSIDPTNLGASTSNSHFNNPQSPGSNESYSNYDLPDFEAMGTEHLSTREESLDSDILSVSSSSEEDLLESLSPNDDLYPVVDAVTNRLLQGVTLQSTVNKEPQPTADNDQTTTGNSDNQTRQNFEESGSHQRKNQEKGKRSAGRRSRDDCDEDDAGDEQPSPRSKRPKKNSDIEVKLFACPFWKRDQTKYRHCFRFRLLDINRVKQHLHRKHTPTYYCQRCFKVFDEPETHDAHVSLEKPCKRAPGAVLEGIPSASAKRLSSKAKLPEAISPAEKWYRIWEIVFPDHQRPHSPYIEDQLAYCCSVIQERIQNHGPDLLIQEIEKAGLQVPGQLDDERVRNILRHAFANALDILCQQANQALSQEPARKPTTIASSNAGSSNNDSGIGRQDDASTHDLCALDQANPLDFDTTAPSFSLPYSLNDVHGSSSQSVQNVADSALFALSESYDSEGLVRESYTNQGNELPYNQPHLYGSQLSGQDNLWENSEFFAPPAD